MPFKDQTFVLSTKLRMLKLKVIFSVPAIKGLLGSFMDIQVHRVGKLQNAVTSNVVSVLSAYV